MESLLRVSCAGALLPRLSIVLLFFCPQGPVLALDLKGPSVRARAGEGPSSHSLLYFYTSVSEPGQGLPQFIIVGYVDNQLFYQYDSNFRRVRPRVTWMEKVDSDYWNTQTQVAQDGESAFRMNMETLKNRYNQSAGFHTLQLMHGCELRKDGSKGGHLQYAYNGRDYISLDKETLTWTALDVPAQITKRKWEAEPLMADSIKAYLEVTCIEWLKKYLDYSKEVLLRTEPPVGKVTHQAIGDGQEALICQAYGFYPKDIDTIWRKGEEILEHETFRRNIAPNSDGTYHIWLSIEIDPKEKDLYRCHVDHDSLPEPLVLAFKEPGVNMVLIMAVTIMVASVLLMVTSFVFFKWKRHTKAEKRPKKCQNLGDSRIPTLHPMDDEYPSSESNQISVSSTEELLA